MAMGTHKLSYICACYRVLTCCAYNCSGAAPDIIDALGKQPWRMVCGSVVFGLQLAEWDAPELRTTPEQLANIMRAVIRQSTSPLVTFAWMCSEQQHFEFMPIMRSVLNCGAETVIYSYPDAYQPPGTFYGNSYVFFIYYQSLNS